MEKDPLGDSLSNKGGWQSARDSPVGPICQSLKETLLPTVQKFYADTIAMDKESALALRINSLWANISPKDTYNAEHIHPGSQVSGVLYIKVPENPADINFVNPARNFKMAVNEAPNDVNRYNSEQYFFSPTKGRLLLFPSYLAHTVDLSESEGDRISIAFNASYFIRR